MANPAQEAFKRTEAKGMENFRNFVNDFFRGGKSSGREPPSRTTLPVNADRAKRRGQGRGQNRG